ncbi:MAG: TetR/AcrR family transcriptional regulator [bacterium]|nr:TetR/AcrR family transcriptional regulator [bacterium]
MPMSSESTSKPKPRPEKKSERARDRGRTEHKMIRAVGTLLARDGFQGMGVNALAREAGVDKVLIYRYFGSLDTLIDRYCQEVDFWPTADELISYDETAAMEMPPSERLALIVKNLGRALLRRPLTQEIIAWELAAPSEFSRHLNAARKRVTAETFQRFFPDIKIPDEGPSGDPYREAYYLLIAGVVLLIVRNRHDLLFDRRDLNDDSHWQVFERTIERMCTSLPE